MRKYIYFMVGVCLLAIVGCACLDNEPVSPAPRPAPVAMAEPAPQKTADSYNMVSRTYPCSGCGVLKIEKHMPAEVQLNSPFEYIIKVTNLTGMALHDVGVTDHIPPGFKFISADPAASQKGNALSWMMDMLGPNEVRTITVKGTASEVGWIEGCANATYIIPACAKTKVVQPAIALTKEAPAEVTVCDEISLKFVVTNKGTGVAKNVMITDDLPEGLKTTAGQSKIDIKVGMLDPGQSSTHNVMTKASKTGTYENKAMAMADGGLKAESAVTRTKVTQPILTITKTGTEKQYLGRQLRYDITVTNKGDTAAKNTVIEDTIPAGVEDILASDDGKLAASKVVWKIGDLAAGASKKVGIAYKPTRAGEFSNTASASGVCADEVTASAKTTVAGIAAILLEVIDVSDPIEVGQNETYVITVTNQGTAPDTNIAVTCTLEEGMEYVSSSGSTTGSLSAGTVKFAPLNTLAPKAKATWKLVIKAQKAGDMRFKVSMNSSQLGRVVEETEATNFYE